MRIAKGGNYSINKELPELDYEKVKFYFVKTIVGNIGVQIECSKRGLLNEEWKSKTVNYDSRKYHFEYGIIMLNKVFGKEYIEKLIKERIDYMNKWYTDTSKLNENILRVFSYRCITFDISVDSREVVNKIFTK